MNGNPYLQAWQTLRLFVASGASEREVIECARELGRQLPDARDPVAQQARLVAVEQSLRELADDYTEPPYPPVT